MKKRLFFAALLSLCTYRGFAQDCAPKGISTDPANPVTNPGGRLNTFDYTATGWPFKTLYSTENLWIQSPFYGRYTPATGHLAYPFDGVREMLPADGWELIARDLGYEDNGQPTAEKARNPYIVLYNRHTALLRVFVARYNQQSYNGASIRINFVKGSPIQTSLLDMSAGVKVLDAAFIRNPLLQSLVEFPSSPFEWFYSDFQMAYDPCTCLFESKLEISLDLSNNSSISLNGTGITNQGAPTAGQAAKGPLSFGNLETGAKQGMQKFNEGESMAASLKDAINKASSDTTTIKKLGLTNLVEKITKSDFLKEGLAAIPYATAALGVLKFFIGGGKRGSGNLTPSPVIVRTDYSFSGTIGQEYKNFTNIGFRTPGSQTGNAIVGELPYYNEVLGIFTLLKTPKIVSKLYFPGIVAPGDGGGDSGPYGASFELAEDLEYVLNPAANLEIQEIEFLLFIRNEYGKEQMIPISGTGAYHTFTEGIPPVALGEIMVVLNLKRKNAGPDTQNILLSLKYPIQRLTAKIKEGAALARPGNARIAEFCNSSSYKKPQRFPIGMTYEEAVDRLAQKEREAEEKASNAKTDNRIFETYPNPTQGIFALSLPGGFEGKAQVDVFNMIGEKVHSLSVDGLSQNLEIDITGRPAGLYMVRVSHNGQAHSSKIVLE